MKYIREANKYNKFFPVSLETQGGSWCLFSRYTNIAWDSSVDAISIGVLCEK